MALARKQGGMGLKGQKKFDGLDPQQHIWARCVSCRRSLDEQKCLV